MVIRPEEVGLKEARYSDNNIVISYSTLQNILPYQLKNMTSWYKIMCGCECCISSKSIYSSLILWCECFLSKNKSFNAQDRSSAEMANSLFKTYKKLFHDTW